MRVSEKTCKECGTTYMPRTMGQKACSLPCALAYSRRSQAEERAKQYRKETRVRKARAKTRTEHARDAQSAFNRYVRLRDANLRCISCGQPPNIGQRHASHYRSRAAAPQLAFNLHNVNASCAQCNSFKSGAITEYRIGLALKIGTEKLLALEHNNSKARHSIEYLKRIKSVFNRKARLYTKLRHREMS